MIQVKQIQFDNLVNIEAKKLQRKHMNMGLYLPIQMAKREAKRTIARLYEVIKTK
jgi:hypothetical protein